MLNIEEFRSILIDYKLLQEGMPVGKEWMPLFEELERLNNPCKVEADKYPWYIDSEELIQLINLVRGGGLFRREEKGKKGKVKIQYKEAITDEALKKYLLLSLHKLLFLRWGFDWGLNEKEKELGQITIPGVGCKEFAIVKPPKALGGTGDFVQPFSEEELNALLDISKALNEAKKIQAGREEKNRAALGNMVVKIKAECPEKVLQMNQTDRLNFIADLMCWAGLLEGEQGEMDLWNALKEAKEKGDNLGGIRQERKNNLRSWVNASRNVEIKTFYKKCQGCTEFEKCAISQNLKRFDKI